MVEIVPRDLCGLIAPDLTRLSTRTDVVTAITVHDCGADVADPVAKWRQIDELARSGMLPSHDLYGDVPYNAGVTQDGRILEGRSAQYVGAHAASDNNVANRVSLGVCLIGSGQSIAPAAEEALRQYFAVAAYVGRVHGLLPFDHLDWRAFGGIITACPGPATVAFVAQIRADQRAGKPA